MLKDKENKPIHILIAEPSEIVREGLWVILSKMPYHLVSVEDMDDITSQYIKKPYTVLLVNPLLTINRGRQVLEIKEKFPNIAWVAILYHYFPDHIMTLFDETISLFDPPESIANKLQRMHQLALSSKRSDRSSVLSERETEVLLHLASGKSNKEIADILNISINTVITHRKNITQKTGIKTVSGLTIYALSQGLINP
jgi:DNA-binding NarL/FixJ family response regulator